MTNPNDPILCVGTMEGHNGLTKREYFAAMSLQALDISAQSPADSAQWAVEYADALIKELNK